MWQRYRDNQAIRNIDTSFKLFPHSLHLPSSWYLLLIEAQCWELPTLTDFGESRACNNLQIVAQYFRRLTLHVRATYSAAFLEQEHLSTKGSNHFIAYPLKKKKKKAFYIYTFYIYM